MAPYRLYRLRFGRLSLRCLLFFIVSFSVYQLWDSAPAVEAVTPLAGPSPWHPIDELIQNATFTFDDLVSKHTTTLSEAAKAYRKRRGRYPPPDFHKWYEFARMQNAVIIEDFFDQIYEDLRPFWGVPARQIRLRTKRIHPSIVIRDGKVITPAGKGQRSDVWISMLQQIEHLLPDLVIPLNPLDEPRVAVPWEKISNYVELEMKTRSTHPSAAAVMNFTQLDWEDSTLPDEPAPRVHGTYWEQVRAGCPSDALARDLLVSADFAKPPAFCTQDHGCLFDASSPFMHYGFVSNWTTARDPCWQPSLPTYHGGLIEPLSQFTTDALIPIFGSSKLSMNNDILLPSFSYWEENSDYATGSAHGPSWEQKSTRVTWRGIASSGRIKPSTWTRFHRHRFIAVMNASSIQHASDLSLVSPTFTPEPYTARLQSKVANLVDWLRSISDVAFTNLYCFKQSQDAVCAAMAPHYEVAKGIPMHEQFTSKYLPDIDGNAFSGRYLAFLRSTSVPIKSTIYSEWHDARLVPWVHFVPMHTSFTDLYGILEYFIGYSKGVGKNGKMLLEGGHDAQAENIATAGKEWAERVLRREDMLVYLLRLLLEFRRVCEERREEMGYIDDLVF